MSAHKIVSDGERVGTIPVSAPAYRVNVDRPGSVLRRCGRRLTEFYRAIDFGYVGFTLAVAVTVFVLTYVALGRGA